MCARISESWPKLFIIASASASIAGCESWFVM
jgi:hypothetical protein